MTSNVDANGASIASRQVLTLAGAKRIAAAAEAEAQRRGWKVNIAIVDDGGHLVHFTRMDDVQTASVAVAIGKARTAAMFRRPTKAIEDVIAGGRTALVTFPDVVAAQGGVPIVVGGIFLGGVGVSGVQSDQDEIVAKAGADALK